MGLAMPRLPMQRAVTANATSSGVIASVDPGQAVDLDANLLLPALLEASRPHYEGPAGVIGPEAVAGGRATPQYWYALWTKSHCEQLVYDQLRGGGFDPFLPRVEIWSRHRDQRRVMSVPMFPGYVLLRHPAMTKTSYVEARRCRGLVRILGERWDRLGIIPDTEIDGIRRALEARVPLVAHPYLRDGDRVRIVRGPLAEVEGILVRTKPSKGLVVLSVELLQRSVAVEVDCTWVTPA